MMSCFEEENILPLHWNIDTSGWHSLLHSARHLGQLQSQI